MSTPTREDYFKVCYRQWSKFYWLATRQRLLKQLSKCRTEKRKRLFVRLFAARVAEVSREDAEFYTTLMYGTGEKKHLGILIPKDKGVEATQIKKIKCPACDELIAHTLDDYETATTKIVHRRSDEHCTVPNHVWRAYAGL